MWHPEGCGMIPFDAGSVSTSSHKAHITEATSFLRTPSRIRVNDRKVPGILPKGLSTAAESSSALRLQS
jgi:hypothetical protein